MLLWVPALLLAAHLLYFLFLPSLAAKAVSALGCVITLALTLGPVMSRRVAAGVRSELGAIGGRRALPLIAVFGLPLLSSIVQPSVTFWRLDARAMLIIAWLAALSCLLFLHRTEAPRSVAVRGRLPVLTQLFILWSALFWLMVIWDVGVGRAVVAVAREDRLTTSFALWESRPASEHLFLVWLTRESFEQGVAYTNHPHPILFFFYGCSKLVQLATGLPLYVGRNLTPFAMAGLGALAFAALVPRPSARAPQGAKFHATLFLALGFLLSQWHFWVYPFASNFDTVFPVIAYLMAVVWASAYPRVSARNAGRVTASLVLFAAFGWVYTPLVLLAVWCVFGRPRAGLSAMIAANRPLVRASIAAAAAGVAVYALPLVLVAIRGYENTTSSFLFRSGLDGDTRYFRDVAQAVFQPFAPSRTWWSLLFPAFVPFVIAAGCAWRAGGLTRRRFGRQSIFFVAPYFFSLAFFPQAVSIHPYLYDVLLLLPVALIGSTWMLTRCVQDRLRGPSLLAALLLAAMLVMANLIGVAQGMLRVTPLGG